MEKKIEGLMDASMNRGFYRCFFFLLCAVFFFFVFSSFVVADPQPPSILNVTANETSSLTSQPGHILNTSGGYITTMNLTSNVQNKRWKAFVGWVSGKFSLDDMSGSTIYDWDLASVRGQVYATRNSSVISWANINCSNVTHLLLEDYNMNHTNPSDNITYTFGNGVNSSHAAFTVGSKDIFANTCPGLNTYIGNSSQDTDFEEIVLYDGASIVYSTIIESGGQVGFDSNSYDFQMIVPENGANTWASSTAYYLYVELV
jgi:hypothetical protein